MAIYRFRDKARY